VAARERAAVSEIDEIVGEFLVESYENLDRFDDDLLALERDPTDSLVISSVFRTIHTVKGTSGFFGFTALEGLAHVAENLLGKLRAGELPFDEAIASALLATGDAIRRMLAHIERTGEEGEVEIDTLVATLTALQEPRTPAAPDAPEEAEEAVALRLGELLVDRGAVDLDDVTLAAHEQDLGDDRLIGEILVDHGAAVSEEVEEAVLEQRRAGGRGLAETSIRVDVGLLDELMNLVGELVLARNQIVQLVTAEQDSGFSGASQRLNLITTDVLVTNPTHLVVALRYDPDELAPRVVAKGADQVADRLKVLAHRHGVPVTADLPLARALYRQCRVGQHVPSPLYEAVAVVLALAYRRTGHRPGARLRAGVA
jgi:two-component system, chemotaxis family, sensor kinase CheA